MQDPVVIIVGAGPSGLSAAASLRHLLIPFIILEREDCYASLWKKFAYDRLQLHIPKQYCQLPHMPFPESYPKYVPKAMFLDYFDSYAKKLKVEPLYRRLVESAEREEGWTRWVVRARNLESGEVEVYRGRFLVVATGETSDAYVPVVEGIEGFPGKVIHSTKYKNGKEFKDMNVLVVGSGNSGMEIGLDLADHGARCSIVIRSPVHIISRKLSALAMRLRGLHVPLYIVDSIVVMLSRLTFGDLTEYGIRRPTDGPFFLKLNYAKYPVVDLGTCDKIKSGEIQVKPAIKRVLSGGLVEFVDDESHHFDAIIFCTGFKRSTSKWLKGDNYLLNEDGFSKQSFPNHWKGKNGLYCVGLARRGLQGATADSLLVADDIKSQL